MPYAADGRIAQDEFEGAIEISDQQYSESLDGVMEGKEVSIVDGAMVIDWPKQNADDAIRANILNAPAGLFGGPTLKDTFDGH